MRLLLVLTAALALAPAARAQGLAYSLPADVLAYYRADGGFDEIRKFAGNNGIWNSPLDLDSTLFKEMDKGLEQLGKMIGAETGSLRSYLRSFKSVEGALISLDLEDDFPQVDWVLAMETPQADKIYDLASGALVKRAFGERTEDGGVEVPLEDDFGLHIAQQGDKIVIAGSASRLRTTMGSFGKVVPGNLTQTEDYRTAVGNVQPKSLLYMKIGIIMDYMQQMERQFAPRSRDPRGGIEARQETWRALGMHRLESVGIIETDTYTRLAVSATGPVVPFQMLQARGNPELLAAFPADTAFGITWSGNLLEVWKLFASTVVTNPRIQFAPFIAEQIRNFQKQSGLKVEQVAEVFDRGLALGVVPDADGRIDDEPVIIARTSDIAKARAVAQQLMDEMGPTETSGKPNVYEEGDTTFLHPDGRRRDDPVTIAMDDDVIVVGRESLVRKTLASYAGQGPSLRSVGSIKGLKPFGSAYTFLHFNPIFAQENDFSSAIHNLLPGAGMAATMTFTEDTMTMVTSRRVSETIATFALAAAQQESLRGKSRECRENLEKIKDAYVLYQGKHAKHPTSLAQLGFSGENALVCPLDMGPNTSRTPYQIFPGDPQEETRLLRACCGNTRHGRIALDRQGRTRSLSEVRYKKMLKDTKAAGK